MLLVCLLYLPKIGRPAFSIKYWLPWGIFLIGYIILDFSFLGLQLTLQYLLPILIGIIVSSFSYTEQLLKWVGRRFAQMTSVICLSALGYLLVRGYNVQMAATPMFLSVAAALLLGLYFITKEVKHLLWFGILGLVPILSVTRMGILVFLVLLVLHFANRNLKQKLLVGVFGLIVGLLVFQMERFQEKTFYQGSGELSDLTTDIYDNQVINSSGRSAWVSLLEPGIEKKPIWGNGPRADNELLRTVTKKGSGEAHNDYLSIRYNYGGVGLAFLLYGFVGTFLWFYKRFRQSTHWLTYWLTSSFLTLMPGFMLFMFTDNTLKYTIFFPNLFFALGGITASLIRKGMLNKEASSNSGVSSSTILEPTTM